MARVQAKVKSKQTVKNLFGGVPKDASAGKPDEKKLIQVDGLLNCASLDAVSKVLEGMLKTVKAHVIEQAADVIVAEGCKKGKRPANLRGAEGPATAALMLSKKRSNIALSEVQCAQLDEWGIPYDSDVTWTVNTDLLTDEMRALVSERLADIPGADRLFEPTQKNTVSDESVNEAFKYKPEVTREILKVVGQMSVRPTIDGESFYDTLQRVAAILDGEDGESTPTLQ